MPRAPKACPVHRCPNATPCPKHSPKPWEGSTRRRRLPGDWERKRRRILLRDPVCRVCGIRLSTQVDHVDRGDDHRDSNLQGICDECHRTKSSAEGNTARKEMANG